jgi:hypothetical protein
MTDASAVGLQSVTLVSAPLAVWMTLGDRTQLSLTGGWVRAWAKSGAGGTSVLQGLRDTNLSLTRDIGGLLLSVEALLPTGDAVATVDEAAVLGVMSSGLLPFGIRSWGSGGGLGGQLAYSLRFGRTRVGVSAGYSAMAGFSPLEDSWSGYDPGAQVHARVVTESEFGVAGVLSTIVGFQRFSHDEIESIAVVSPGHRLSGQLAYAHPLGARESAIVYLGLTHRGSGSVAAIDDAAPPSFDSLLDGPGPLASRQRLAAGAELVLARARVVWRPRAELSVLRAEDGQGQGWLISVGARAERALRAERFGRSFALEPVAALRFGRVTAYEGVSSSVLGWELGASVVSGPVR